MSEKAKQHLLSPDRLAGWDPATAVLIAWFNQTAPPPERFEIYPSVTVLQPGVYWRHLKLDIACGPGRGRSYTQALEKDLRRLAELFGGPAPGEKR